MTKSNSIWSGRPPSYDADTGAFTPRNPPGIARLGAALSGIAAPFVGDMDWAIKQAQLQQRANEADMEFRRHIMTAGQLKPVFTIDANNQPVLLGNVPKGSQVITNPQAPTAEQKNLRISTKQADALFNSLIKKSESLKGGYQGMAEIAKGAVTRGKGESAKYRQYIDTLPATAVAVYRAVTGDTRLSDADAQARALPLLWHPSEDVDVRTSKNTFVKELLENRKSLLATGNYPDGVIPWEELMQTPADGSLQTSASAEPQKQEIPSYDRKTQKLQQNKRTGEYRVVPR